MFDFTRVFGLLEVALQQAFQGLAVTGLVTGHFVDGVVDGVQAVLLGAGGQVELALGGAVLALDAPCQILLGGIGHVGLQGAAQQLGELGGVLGFLKGGLFPVQADLGIALAMGDAGHAEVHADLGALAGEVGLELLHDVLLVFLGNAVHLVGDAEDVLSGELHLTLDLVELGSGGLADGALEVGGQGLGLDHVTANGTYEFHIVSSCLINSCCKLSCIYRILYFAGKVKEIICKNQMKNFVALQLM